MLGMRQGLYYGEWIGIADVGRGVAANLGPSLRSMQGTLILRSANHSVSLHSQRKTICM